MISDRLLKMLTREVRNAIGIERTPSQVQQWLFENIRHPTDGFVGTLLDDRDGLLAVANRMRIPFIENAPPSSEWE